jgi:hypothetical protein
MNLPNFFLADLPSEAVLTPSLVTEACQSIKRNRERYLATRTTAQIITLLSAVAADWLRTENPFRRLALERGPAETGFSRETMARGLDAFFRELTRERLGAMVEMELGNASRLDSFCSSDAEGRQTRAALARGPGCLVHIAAGNLPSPALMSLVLGILVRSAQFMKCASGSALLPRLFAHSLYEVDSKLGACLELAAWPGGSLALEEALFGEADCVTATGSDAALGAIRQRLPARVRFLGYGHRVSFAFVAGKVLTGLHLPRVVSRAAADVTAWNQLGCLSPHVIYVEQGGEADAKRFAVMLADELKAREEAEPRGTVPDAVAAGIASRRAIYEVRAAHSQETQMWRSADSTAWTVVYEADPRFQSSCLNRFVYVKPVADLAEVLRSADPIREQLSTVGIAVPEHLSGEVATQLAQWGATRVCPLGRMQEPPLAWRHDGRPALSDLVTWTDLEM